MAMIPYFAVFFLCVFTVSSNVYETHLNIEREGYIAETHFVITDDGYVLQMHRIPFRWNETTGLADRPVVFLLHGLMGASQNFIALGRDYAMAYNLADAGFDVWLGNARGNRNSRNHITLDPDVDRLEFFDFSWHEIGNRDVPAVIDYILERTPNQRLHYIGHSQGGTSFLVMASTRPEYNEKIATAHLLAPAGYKSYFPDLIMKELAASTNIIWSLAWTIGIIEVVPPNPILPFSDGAKTDVKELWQYCVIDTKLNDFCIKSGVKELMKHIYSDVDIDSLGFGGASLKQIGHYGQNIQADSFRQWDYGSSGNIAVYGTPDPPIYNLTLITANVTMHYTISDTLVGAYDVHAMSKDMPNSKLRRVARDTFGHGGFISERDVRELVTEHIIHVIENYTEPEEPSSACSIFLSFAMKMYLIIITVYHFVN